jgi:hypothetical protein
MVLFGAVAGIVAGGIMILLSHLAPRYGAGEYVKDIDVIVCFGRKCSRRESHVIGLMVHTILYTFFGMLYAVGVEQGIVNGFSLIPLSFYLVLITVILGGIFMPLEGHGLFGVREDKWFIIDLALANLGWVLLYGAFMSIWY